MFDFCPCLVYVGKYFYLVLPVLLEFDALFPYKLFFVPYIMKILELIQFTNHENPWSTALLGY